MYSAHHIILTDYMDFDEDFAFSELRSVITRGMKVLVIASAYRDEDVISYGEWINLYGSNGKKARKIIKPFLKYGIQISDIKFVDIKYVSAELIESDIKNTDIILLTGGFPDLYCERLQDAKITQSLCDFTGCIIGWSAGAMILMSHFFVTRNEYYDDYKVHVGLGLIENFSILPHYYGDMHMAHNIQTFIKTYSMPVYVTRRNGLIIVEKTMTKALGNANLFQGA